MIPSLIFIYILGRIVKRIALDSHPVDRARPVRRPARDAHGFPPVLRRKAAAHADLGWPMS